MTTFVGIGAFDQAILERLRLAMEQREREGGDVMAAAVPSEVGFGDVSAFADPVRADVRPGAAPLPAVAVTFQLVGFEIRNGVIHSVTLMAPRRLAGPASGGVE